MANIMSGPVNLASNFTLPGSLTGWMVRIGKTALAALFLLSFVSCQPSGEGRTDPNLIAKSPSGSSCQQQICKLGDWSIRYFPRGSWHLGNHRASTDTEALEKFQQKLPFGVEGLFVAVIASADVLEGGGGTRTIENVEQRELVFDALMEGRGHERIPLPRGVRNPIRIGDYILNLTGMARIDSDYRKMMERNRTEPRTSARLIGMGMDTDYRMIIFCVQDGKEISEINSNSFSRCINIAAEI